ncbi:MAG: Transposase, IS607 family [Parcubacteria group bacterium GW2011_GWA1_50_14]|nr:MAG: Transposase, IS607 family [Parcubacteria group bacterium GW2011_GWA1_50_14]
MQNSRDIASDKFSIGRAAKYLGVSIDTLRRWGKKGKLAPHRSPGGHRYFLKSSLDILFQVPKRKGQFLKKAGTKKGNLIQPGVKPKLQTFIVEKEESIAVSPDTNQVSYFFPKKDIEIPPVTPVRILQRSEMASFSKTSSFIKRVDTEYSFSLNPRDKLLKIIVWLLVSLAIIDFVIIASLIIARNSQPLISPVL